MAGKVLVVDDSPTMRRIVANTLKRIGYSETEEAENGKEALAKLGEGAFELIVTDWNMPGMTGLDFVRSLRADGNYKDLPVLMVTTRSAEEDVKEALQAGANSYIVKPFTPQVLKEKIDSIV